MQQPPFDPNQQPYPQYPHQPYSQYPQQAPYNPQQYPQAPYPPPGAYNPVLQPPKKKRGKLPLIIGGIVALLLFACIGASVISASHGSTTTAATTTQSNTASTGASSQPASSGKWTTTHTFKGNGSKKTATFSVGDDWKITWSCTPSSFYGGTYNVIITPNGTDNVPVDSGVNATCKAGDTSGETEIHQSGTVYLDILSEGDYTIQVQELK